MTGAQDGYLGEDRSRPCRSKLVEGYARMSEGLKKVLVAIDGSEHAALAARVATDLSGRAGSELHVVHAWREPTFLNRSLGREEANRLLEEGAEEAREAGGTIAGVHLREGRPAEAIADLAGELGAGLIVVGSRGLGTVKRLVVGSVSEGVVSLAPCATLVVHDEREGASWPPSRLVVGDDGSEEARRAGLLAAEIGRLFDARVLLLRTYPLFAVYRARKVEWVRTPGDVLAEGRRALEKRADALEGALGARPEVRVFSGDAAVAIQEIAEEGGGPALVAMGRRGTGAVRYPTLGGVAADVLRSATGGTVLIVPPAGEEWP